MSKHSYLRAELEDTGLSCYVLEIAGLVSPANFYLVDAPRDRLTSSRGFLWIVMYPSSKIMKSFLFDLESWRLSLDKNTIWHQLKVTLKSWKCHPLQCILYQTQNMFRTSGLQGFQVMLIQEWSSVGVSRSVEYDTSRHLLNLVELDQMRLGRSSDKGTSVF